MKKVLSSIFFLLLCLTSFAEVKSNFIDTTLDQEVAPIEATYHSVETRAYSEGQWEEIGIAEWTDGVFYIGDDTSQPYKTNIAVEKNTEIHGVFRIYPGSEFEPPLYSSYLIIHCEDPDKVYLEPFIVNVNGRDYTLIQATQENGWKINETFHYGSFKDGIITIPSENAFVIYDTRNVAVLFNDFKLKLPSGYNYEDPDASDSGVYMGLISFNDLILKKPVRLLNQASSSEFTSFVDNMELGNATLLYYAVDSAIDELESYSYPSDLSKAILITFTDGLDQGSLAKKPEYRTSRGYASYLSERIANTTIQDVPLEAYSIGLRSKDVLDDDLFMYNLSSIATAASGENTTDDNDYVSTVRNIKELEEKLNSIYETVHRQTLHRDIVISVPLMSHEDVIRFTLDNADDDVHGSNIWFEGVFNMDNMCFEDVKYHGFTTSCGPVLETTLDGIFISFTLKDCKDLYGNPLDTEKDDIDQWTYIPSRDDYQHNYENTKQGEIKVEDHKSTVAIMFALDASSSLSVSEEGNLFPLLKSTATSFINLLAGNTTLSGIDMIEKDKEIDNLYDDAQIEFYSLQGLRVTNPSSGLYIYKKGNKAGKVLIH